MLEHLKQHLKGKVVIMGIGNSLRSDDGVGSLLASRIREKVPYIVYDVGPNPENYLGKVIKDKPENIVIVDAADFGGKPGEFRELEDADLQTLNLFTTHDASLSMVMNYLKSQIKADIILLIIQPKSVAFGDHLSAEIEGALSQLEEFFSRLAKDTGS